jgi:hypothetical protein
LGFSLLNLKCQATVITGFRPPFRLVLNPYHPPLPVKATAFDCPFAVIVYFNFATDARCNNFPNEVSSALSSYTEVSIQVSPTFLAIGFRFQPHIILRFCIN